MVGRSMEAECDRGNEVGGETRASRLSRENARERRKEKEMEQKNESEREKKKMRVKGASEITTGWTLVGRTGGLYHLSCNY